MNTWAKTIICGVALLAGCEGAISGQSSSGSGASSGTGNNSGSGTGNSVSSGTGNTGNNVATGSGGAGGSTSIVDPTLCTPGIPATSQLPRLTRSEYDKTVRDLLGIDISTSPPSSMLAPDTLGSVDQRAWDGFKTAADTLSKQVTATTTARAKVTPCTTDNATCINQFVTTFGQKAFRRPLTTAEITKFTSLYTNKATLTQSGTFDQAITLIVKAFLMSPTFLTKAETSTALA